MKIYTGNTYGEEIQELVNRDMGIMVASSASFKPDKCFKNVSCSLDNGAFQMWRSGYPFIEDYFISTLKECYRLGMVLDFIVVPDIVAAGLRSLDFTMSWVREGVDLIRGGGILHTANNLALVVQDGMRTSNITFDIREYFTTIFVGGTEEWKWKTAKMWCDFAHEHNKKCHIGRVGTLDRLTYSKSIGVDSVDSVSFTRNKSWHIIDELNAQQLDLFNYKSGGCEVGK